MVRVEESTEIMAMLLIDQYVLGVVLEDEEFRNAITSRMIDRIDQDRCYRASPYWIQKNSTKLRLNALCCENSLWIFPSSQPFTRSKILTFKMSMVNFPSEFRFEVSRGLMEQRAVISQAPASKSWVWNRCQYHHLNNAHPHCS